MHLILNEQERLSAVAWNVWNWCSTLTLQLAARLFHSRVWSSCREVSVTDLWRCPRHCTCLDVWCTTWDVDVPPSWQVDSPMGTVEWGRVYTSTANLKSVFGFMVPLTSSSDELRSVPTAAVESDCQRWHTAGRLDSRLAGEPGEVTARTARKYETFCVQHSIRRLDSRSCEADCTIRQLVGLRADMWFWECWRCIVFGLG